ERDGRFSGNQGRQGGEEAAALQKQQGENALGAAAAAIAALRTRQKARAQGARRKKKTRQIRQGSWVNASTENRDDYDQEQLDKNGVWEWLIGDAPHTPFEEAQREAKLLEQMEKSGAPPVHI